MIEILNQGWIGALLGLIGIAFGLYQMLRRSGHRLVFQVTGQRIIQNRFGIMPKEFRVTFEGKDVENLSLTQILVWNSGPGALRHSDIIADDPIRFYFDSSDILKADIVKTTRKVNKPRIDINQRSSITVDFDFLDYNDGLLISVFHGSENIEPRASGTIIGSPNGIKNLGFVPQNQIYRFASSFGLVEGILTKRLARIYSILHSTLFVFMAPFFLVASLVVLSNVYLFGNYLNFPESEIAPLTLFSILILFVVFMGSLQRRRFPKKLLPDYEQ